MISHFGLISVTVLHMNGLTSLYIILFRCYERLKLVSTNIKSIYVAHVSRFNEKTTISPSYLIIN